MLRIGIISYLPDTGIRERRKTVIKKTLEDLIDLTPETSKITIIAQNYDMEADKDIYEYNEDRVNCIFYEAGIGQCAARNRLLSDFYASDDDFIMYTDDDTSFYDRYGSRELFEAIHTHPEWFTMVDCFTSLEGRFSPFTAENEKLGLEKLWVFKPMQFATSGEFRVLKNIKKFYNKEFYYDSGLKYGEDLHFRIKYLSQINSFVCRNLISRNRGLVDNICTLDEMSLAEQHTLYSQVTQDVYDMMGIPRTDNGRYDLSDYRCKVPYVSISRGDGTTSTTPGPAPKKLF